MACYEDLKGKTVFITGSNRGIGLGIAKAFIENECRVVLLYREAKPDLECSQQPVYLQADVRDRVKIAEWLESFEDSGLGVDVLVNNAGINENKLLIDADEDHWDRIMDVNLKAVFFLSRLMARHMAGRGGGVIINASSFAVKLPLPGYSVYAASKAALLSVTKSMAAEWAPYGVRVNAYAPGIIETDMTRDAISKNKDKLLKDISLNRFGSPEEIADSVLFLASRSASYITGMEMDVSGGKFLNQNPGAIREYL